MYDRKETTQQAAARLGLPELFTAMHEGRHVCIDGRHYNVSCLITDPDCDDIARSRMKLPKLESACPDHDCRFAGCGEWTAGYRGQREWLIGKSLRDAENALASREATLEVSAFNLGGSAATRDFIAEIQRRAAEMSAAS